MPKCQCNKTDGTPCGAYAMIREGMNHLYCINHQNCKNPQKLLKQTSEIYQKQEAEQKQKMENQETKSIKYIPMKDNNEQYRLFLQMQHQIYYNNLPEEQKIAIAKYTGSYYKKMNMYLRKQITSTHPEFKEIKQTVKNLQLAIDNSPPTTQPIIVYRGITITDLPYKLSKQVTKAKIGDVVDLIQQLSTHVPLLTMSMDLAVHSCYIYLLESKVYI